MRRSAEIKVGLLVLVALVVLASAIFLIGEDSQLFVRKNTYRIRFETVGGLNTGNPVQLNGVDVGTVHRIVLPVDPEQSEIQVDIEVNRRFAERVREDSVARIKTLGLLGDKFIEITSGSPAFRRLEDGELIPTAPATSVDQLIASGEDVVGNVTAISVSLRAILNRIESGEGLLGELTSESDTGRKVTGSIVATMESFQHVAEKLDTGEGPVPRLINDPEMADRLESSLIRLEGVLDRVENGDGLLPRMLDDTEIADKFEQTLTSLSAIAANLEVVSRDLAEGEGLLSILLKDEEYGKEISEELRKLLTNLNVVTGKVGEGEGSVAQLLNDPAVYEALNDILVGVNESKFLRWLIRNRQKSGIKKRYKEDINADPESVSEILESDPS